MINERPSLPIERITSKMTVSDSGCWIWSGYLDEWGYGRLRVGGVAFKAHRYSFVAHGGTFDDGPMVLHSCNTPACVNPAHLRAGTALDNMADRREAGGYYDNYHGHSTLTREDVVRIREMCRDGIPQRETASLFGITSQAVSKINRGARWGQVPGPINPKVRRLKISDAQVEALRARVAAGASYREVSLEFGISDHHAADIAKRKVRTATLESAQ